MRFFLRYLSLEGKKSLIAARKSMVKFIVMLLLIAGGVLAVSLVMKDAGVFQTAEIGVVIPEDEAQTKMVAQFISAMDSVKSVCHFQYLNQDKAMASLEKGTLDAVLSLPEQFYEDVDSGKNTPATIYFPENAPLNTRVFGELVADGVSLLRTAEAGVYATYDTAQIYQAEISRDQIGDVISELYIYEAFDRTSVFQKNVYSSLGKADIHQYYFSAAVLLLFLMMGVNYGYLYQKQSRAVEEKIRIYGIGEGKNALIKVLLMTVPLWLVGVLVYAVGCLVSGKYHLSFLWFDREVAWNTASCSGDCSVFSTDLYDFGREHQRNDRAACGQCFSDHGFRCCDPYCISAGTFWKNRNLFSTDLLGQLLSEIIVFRNQRAGDKAADSHVCCAFCGQRVMGKSGRTFWKGRTGGT